MTSLNTCVLSGLLAKDPEHRTSSTGLEIANGVILVNHAWKTRTGEAKEESSSIEFRVFGKVAEALAKRLRKGCSILLHGRIAQERWVDAGGEPRQKVVLIADRFENLMARETEPQQ